MRMLLFLLLLSSIVSAQTRIDTAYHINGAVRSITYAKMVTAKELSKAELFQRGLTDATPDTEIRMKDSIQVFDTLGHRVYDRVQMVIELDRGREEMAQARREALAEKKRLREATAYGMKEKLLVYEDLIRLRGRIGETGSGEVTLKNISDKPITLRMKGRTSDITVPAEVMLPADSTMKIAVSVDFKPVEGQTSFEITNGRDIRFDLPIHYSAYHLTEDDFQEQLPTTPTLHLRSRPEMVLRLVSGEKLLTVHSEGVAIGKRPVGRVLDKIDISRWPAGHYVLELKDLANQTSRYAGILLE